MDAPAAGAAGAPPPKVVRAVYVFAGCAAMNSINLGFVRFTAQCSSGAPR